MRSTDLTIEARIQRRENWRALRERCKMKIEEEEKRVDYSTTMYVRWWRAAKQRKEERRKKKDFLIFK